VPLRFFVEWTDCDESVLQRADRCLYDAKAAGRNPIRASLGRSAN
jgi:PleD family two-component response regulator